MAAFAPSCGLADNRRPDYSPAVMKKNELADLSLAELRDRLISRIEIRDPTDDLVLSEVLRHFASLPASSYSSDGAAGLIHLARNFSSEAQPAQMLQAASLGAQMAVAVGDQPLLCRARNKEGFALAQLGRLSEATIAQAEAWSVARALGDRKLEMFAVWGFSTICVAMGQWDVAIRHCERMSAMADEVGLPQYALMGRCNIADCAVQLRDPAAGLSVLNSFELPESHRWDDARLRNGLHVNLGRLYLLVGDVAAAKFHSDEASRWAAKYGSPDGVQLAGALRGLVLIRLGEVDSGLSAVNRSLTFAKSANRAEVPNCLATCMEACESAGYLDKALGYLQELVDWKKESINAEIMALQFDGLTENTKFHTGNALFDDALLARAHSLQASIKSRIERLIEIALNAEIVSGHDLCRAFRVAKLARYLAAALGWDEERIAPLVLGAQVCNIGMIAIPSRILLKTTGLEDNERNLLRDHASYGAELLRKAKLQMLDVPSMVAEQHHERHDGSGYPCGLRGEAIEEEARIVAICDVFDALTHRRPWRAPLTIQMALGELESSAGAKFDPLLVTVFVDLVRSEFWRPSDMDTFLAEGAEELEYVSARARMEALIGADTKH